MATIIPEDGSGMPDSNSYVSEAELTAYALDRGITLDKAPDILIIRAMDYIESNDFIGYKNTNTQALQWPRMGAVIDGYEVGTDEIPQLLKDAEMEVCIGIDQGTDPLAVVPRETIKEKVDVIEVEYSDKARDSAYLKAAETKLEKLVRTSGIKVVRA